MQRYYHDKSMLLLNLKQNLYLQIATFNQLDFSGYSRDFLTAYS